MHQLQGKHVTWVNIRDVAEDSQGGACVECCGSKRCKTCDHI